MIHRFKERVSLFVAKSPQKAVLVGIMLFNAVFILVAAGVIAALSQHISGLKQCSFWVSVYRTITMMLDAGCIESVVEDVGKAGAVAAIVCLGVVMIGMVFFSGAVIGYVTNTISDFIDSKNNGRNKLIISGHVVIINWNPRAAEIINEFLYDRKEVKVVVFVPDRREEISEEIRNRLDMTLLKEGQQIREAAERMPYLQKKEYLRKNLLHDNITYIVREGDVAAATDLDDICISKAKTVIILDHDNGENQAVSDPEQGNTQTIKTLIQVSEISKGNSSQLILVEVADDWTEELVYNIMEFKGEEGKEKIIPVSFNRLLGKTYSQIAVMPELDDVYNTLFSNRGAHFLSQNVPQEYSRTNENAYIEKCLSENCCSVPLTVMDTIEGKKAFFMADKKADLAAGNERFSVPSTVRLKKEHSCRKRTIVVYGHNSNMDAMMEGFEFFRKERMLKGVNDPLIVVMIDDEESLKSHDYYREYPFVETLPAGVYDEETIKQKILEVSHKDSEETTILLLSDDRACEEDVDAVVLTYLIYIQKQLRWLKENEPEFRREQLDVIAEILNPKNEEIVKSYGADRVIVSNRYISRVISQISLGEAIYEFYAEIFSYDMNDGKYYDKEIFLENAGEFFEELPGKCTADVLIRTVFQSGAEHRKSMLLGYIRDKKTCVFFHGDQRAIDVGLKPDDKLVLYSTHSV